MSAAAQRYTAVAIVLHWAIAAALALMIPLGFWMHEEAEHGGSADALFQAYQLHKSIGLTVLALSVLRLAWRLINPPPPLPAQMPAWERFVAKAVHWAFYALIIGLPLSGWLYVSAGWSIHDEAPLLITTEWFGLFVVPHLFGLPQASADVRESVAEGAMYAHFVMAWSVVGLAALHVAAALKHHFVDRDEVLAHMVPGMRAPNETAPPPRSPVRLALLGGGLGLTAVALAAAIYVLGGLETQPAPGAEQAPASIEAQAPAPAAPEAEALAPAPAAPGAPPAWRVDAGASAIRFAFSFNDEDAGETTRFEGRFNRWRADIRFDPDNLEASSARVVIELASAVDGVPLHERTLPTEPWFNVPAHPSATYSVREFRRRGGDRYEARGELSLRGRNREVRLPFTLTISGDRAVMDGSASIDRRDFDIGVGSEADELISREVEISVHVEAERAS